jgi:uncharacterized protein YeaO (DUF488 family)
VRPRVRRVYDPPCADDGYRVLVDRLWPRGLRREQARLDLWLKEIAPSDGLRRFYGHDPSRWEEFRRRYDEELRSPERRRLLEELAARGGTVTLLTATRDVSRSAAEVLRQALARRGARGRGAGGAPAGGSKGAERSKR